MPAAHPVNEPSWTPPRLILTFTGHLFTGTLKLLVVVLLCMFSTLFSDSMSARFGNCHARAGGETALRSASHHGH